MEYQINNSFIDFQIERLKFEVFIFISYIEKLNYKKCYIINLKTKIVNSL